MIRKPAGSRPVGIVYLHTECFCLFFHAEGIYALRQRVDFTFFAKLGKALRKCLCALQAKFPFGLDDHPALARPICFIEILYDVIRKVFLAGHMMHILVSAIAD